MIAIHLLPVYAIFKFLARATFDGDTALFDLHSFSVILELLHFPGHHDIRCDIDDTADQQSDADHGEENFYRGEWIHHHDDAEGHDQNSSDEAPLKAAITESFQIDGTLHADDAFDGNHKSEDKRNDGDDEFRFDDDEHRQEKQDDACRQPVRAFV